MNQASFLTVLKGKYKNKKIPIPKKIHGHNNVTPQKIKESVFQIIENNLTTIADPPGGNAVFVDLFGGSGQMGIEAVSRGYSHAFFFDISKERIQKLNLWIRQHMPGDFQKCSFEVKDGVREFNKILTGNTGVSEYLLENPDIKELVIFADPPYGLNAKRKYLIDYLLDYFLNYKSLIKTENQHENFRRSIIVIIQTCKDDIYRSAHSSIENFLETGQPDFIKGFYEYGRHRLIVL